MPSLPKATLGTTEALTGTVKKEYRKRPENRYIIRFSGRFFLLVLMKGRYMRSGCEVLARVAGKSVEEYEKMRLGCLPKEERESAVVEYWERDNSAFFHELTAGARKKDKSLCYRKCYHKGDQPADLSQEAFRQVEQKILAESPCASKMILIDEYAGYTAQIRMRCSHCGLVKKMSPRTWVEHKGFCERCSGTPRYPFDSYQKKIKALLPNVEMTSYYHEGQRLSFRCQRCGYEWSAFQYQIENAKGCPMCVIKEKESAVASQLKQYCLEQFRRVHCEYRKFRNPETNAFLPFDIYIEDVGLFVEVNGVQHYKWNRQYVYISSAGSKKHKIKMARKAFIRRIHLDNLKKQYAEQHGHYLAIDIRKYDTIDKAVALLWREIGLISEAKKSI